MIDAGCSPPLFSHQRERSVQKGAARLAVSKGDALVIRYEGPKGGPGMQEMLYPTSYLKSKGLGKVCALITDGRFSGGSSGLCIGHISPEAAEAGAIALVEEGDIIQIDIPNRILRVNLSDAELAKLARASSLAKCTARKDSAHRTQRPTLPIPGKPRQRMQVGPACRLNETRDR